MKPELEDILQQSGVKGMKWGKRKAEVKGDKAPSKIKAKVDSVKREHGWNKTLKNAKNMSTKDIQKLSARAQLENDMKRLSKERHVGSKKDKQDYIKRANMSDQELLRKVQRLRAKSNLKRTAGDATKSQKEAAKKIITVVGPLALQYALTGSIGKRDLTNAAVNAAVNLGGEKARIAKTVYDQGKPAKKVKHGEEMDDVLLHSLMEALLENDDTLQHHGIKGMKWGKHLVNRAKARGAARKERIKTENDIIKRRKAGIINRKQAHEERWHAFHKEQSHNEHYKKTFDKLIAKGHAPKKAMRAAYKTAQARKKLAKDLVVAVAGGTLKGIKAATAKDK